jgi:hypothetical protein
MTENAHTLLFASRPGHKHPVDQKMSVWLATLKTRYGHVRCAVRATSVVSGKCEGANGRKGFKWPARVRLGNVHSQYEHDMKLKSLDIWAGAAPAY